LYLVAEGLVAPEIGRKLGISDRTVEWHIDKSMKKLEAKNRIQAVVLAIRDGQEGVLLRFGSLADMSGAPAYVRIGLESGHAASPA
jgi:orotate phosphoribosyltransferase-like protein